jgi:hypothetical protein
MGNATTVAEQARPMQLPFEKKKKAAMFIILSYGTLLSSSSFPSSV